MQNLLLKTLVLTGVIAGSCYVVWRAHESLQNVESSTDPQEFAALDHPGNNSVDSGDSLSGLAAAPSESTTTELATDESTTDGWSGSSIGTSPPAELEDVVARSMPELEPTPAPVFPSAHKDLATAAPAPSFEPAPLQQEFSSEGGNSLVDGPSEQSTNPFNPADVELEPTPAAPLNLVEQDTASDANTADSPTSEPRTATPLSFYSSSRREVPQVTMQLDGTTSETFSASPAREIPNSVEPSSTPAPEQGIELVNFETETDATQENTDTAPVEASISAASAAPLQAVEPAPWSQLAPTPLPQESPTGMTSASENRPVSSVGEPSPQLRSLPAGSPGPVLIAPEALPTLGTVESRSEPTRRTGPVMTADLSYADEAVESRSGPEPVNPFAAFQHSPANEPIVQAGSETEELPLPPVTPSFGEVMPESAAGLAPPAQPQSTEDNPFARFRTPPPATTTPLVPVEPQSVGFDRPPMNNSPPPVGNPFEAAPPQPTGRATLGSATTEPESSTSSVPGAGPLLPSTLELPSTANSAVDGDREDTQADEVVLPELTLPEPKPLPTPSSGPQQLMQESPIQSTDPVFPDIPRQPDPRATASDLPRIQPAPDRSRSIPTTSEPFTATNDIPPSPDSERGTTIPNPYFTNEPAPPTPVGTNVTPLSAEAGNVTGIDRTDLQATPTSERTAAVPSTIPTPVEPTPNGPIIGEGTVDPTIGSDQQSPELKIEKIAPPNATIGEPLVYAIRIRNVGGSAARSVIVEDRVPKGTRLEGTIPQAVLTKDSLTWNLGTIGPREERTIKLKVIPTEAGDIGSVATVSFEAAVAATIKVTAPKLSVEIDGPVEALLGKNVPFKFTIRNTGQGDAKDVVLRAVLPPELRHPSGHDIEADLGSIPAGEARAVELVVVADQLGVCTPKVMVWTNGKTQTETQTDLRIIESRLKVTRQGPKRRFVGRPAQYLTQVTNDSSQPLTNITVTEQLPNFVDLRQAMTGWDPQRRVLVRSIAVLNPGETQELTTELVPVQAGNLVGKLVVADNAGNQAEVETAMSVEGFASLEADVDGQNKVVAIGDQVSLRLNLKNDGTAPASNVRASFEIPAGLTFTNASGPGRYEVVGNRILFEPVANLPTNTEKAYDIVLTAAEAGTTKVKVMLESADYEEPIQIEEPVRILDDSF